MHFTHHEGRRCGGRGFAREFGGRFGGGFGFGRFSEGGRGHGGPFGGPGGRHGGRRRRFDAEALRLVVLKLIAEEPRHGYDIIRAMDELSGGNYAPSPGVIYPMLSMLAEMGLIAQAEGDSTRRSFAITPDGEAYLVAHAEAAEAAMARLKALAEAAGVDPTPVRRAMANLAAVLQAKLREGGADKAALLDVAALIDEAAQKIERL
ncbi:PadR family transcriptional regulator [Sandaracinobacter neustonicus]|uniref:PadR family transcriptional regulator n=1 Tax=Sandaracinobacter neustonicus TaxID=1715348 RepID=A0A501XMN8_9SPHN|nr:PadR family transcriptional regulator [Sandaracinobacter neustonicus]TPE61397.1 PadR family transcriptional regulator [Sandaracinobacter neustonicus]